MKKEKNNDIVLKWHSLAHVMAAAVGRLFPEAKFGIGPVIENGFYYDFELKRQLTPEDLPAIEKEMRKIIKENLAFEREEVSIDEAVSLFKKLKQDYKVELLKDLKKRGTTVIKDKEFEDVAEKSDKVSYYKTGKFVDLCRGPHVKSTAALKGVAFELQKLAGAYWRGDEKNPMLQRIYAVAFETQKELEDYKKFLEEAERRDHRKIGKEQELFLIDQTVGQGLPMWLPKGALIWRIMEDFWYNEHLKNGYELVRSPHIGNRSLWEKSGHWNFYRDSMYSPIKVEDEEYLLKPMNCPFHLAMYNSTLHSYRELPIRWAETGTVYRYEKSGELSGLTRVRGFTQDDAHIICTKEQVESELGRVVDFITFMLGTFGFKDYNVYLSLRDPKDKKKYAGHDEGWEFTERILEKVAKEKKLNYVKEEGEAAFYGPKLDFKIKDCLGREWQCSTLQFDFNEPERFDLKFINEKGEEEQPYMLHRALFGSFERFIGVLIEHYAGAWPVWLAPVQIKLINVGVAHEKHVLKLAEEFRALGFRVEADLSNETVGNKIRKSEKAKVPYMLVIGDKEMKSKDLHVRIRGKKEVEKMSKKKFVERLTSEIENKK